MDREPIPAKLAGILAVVVGCSGQIVGGEGPAPSPTSADAPASSKASASSDRAEPPDATFADRLSPPTAVGAMLSDAGGPLDATFADRASPVTGGDASWDGRVPQSHTVSGAACPEQRGPGFFGCNPDGGVASPTALECVTDSDCTMGKNGRCTILPVSSPPPTAPGDHLILLCGSSCSYDQCFSNSDCPTRVPCGCRSSASNGADNVCLTGSDCAVDSDCGPGGFCSPSSSEQTGGHILYFCHTAADACFDNIDCPNNGGCQFDSVSGHWICVAPEPIIK